jgi:hypothetical protein
MDSAMTQRLLALAFTTFILVAAPNSYAQKAALIQDVDEPSRNAFRSSCGFNTFGAPNGALTCSLGFVPAGKVLVVETVTGHIGLFAPAVLREIVFLPGNHRLMANVLPQSKQPDPRGDFQELVVSQALRTYALAGEELRVAISAGNSIEVDAGFTMSGYLVSKP